MAVGHERGDGTASAMQAAGDGDGKRSVLATGGCASLAPPGSTGVSRFCLAIRPRQRGPARHPRRRPAPDREPPRPPPRSPTAHPEAAAFSPARATGRHGHSGRRAGRGRGRRGGLSLGGSLPDLPLRGPAVARRAHPGRGRGRRQPATARHRRGPGPARTRSGLTGSDARLGSRRARHRRDVELERGDRVGDRNAAASTLRRFGLQQKAVRPAGRRGSSSRGGRRRSPARPAIGSCARRGADEVDGGLASVAQPGASDLVVDVVDGQVGLRRNGRSVPG
jgi:hypothetical protein